MGVIPSSLSSPGRSLRRQQPPFVPTHTFAQAAAPFVPTHTFAQAAAPFVPTHTFAQAAAPLCHPLTLTGCASILILPQLTASSGRAPLSQPSNSCTNQGAGSSIQR